MKLEKILCKKRLKEMTKEEVSFLLCHKLFHNKMEEINDIIKRLNVLEYPIIHLIKINEPNRDCYFYNYGGDLDKGFDTYPIEYGARCEMHKEFFYRNKNNILIPNCYKCFKKD